MSFKSSSLSFAWACLLDGFCVFVRLFQRLITGFISVWRVFKKLMAFCFPEKSASNNSNNDSNSDEVAVTKEKKKKGLYCSLDDSFKKPDVVV